jgi:hypothetical protein
MARKKIRETNKRDDTLEYYSLLETVGVVPPDEPTIRSEIAVRLYEFTNHETTLSIETTTVKHLSDGRMCKSLGRTDISVTWTTLKQMKDFLDEVLNSKGKELYELTSNEREVAQAGVPPVPSAERAVKDS